MATTFPWDAPVGSAASAGPACDWCCRAAPAPLIFDRADLIKELEAMLARPHVPTDRDRVEAAIAKIQAGTPLTPQENAELDRIGALANKGYVTASAGAAVTFRSANGRYQKYGGELNSDRGANGTGEVGFERGVRGANVKMAGKGDTSGASDATVTAEKDVARYGFVRAKAGYETGAQGSQSVSLKGAVEQELAIKGVGGVKPEAYVKVSANKLTPTEQLAIDARMTKNASAFRSMTFGKRSSLEEMDRRRSEALDNPPPSR